MYRFDGFIAVNGMDITRNEETSYDVIMYDQNSFHVNASSALKESGISYQIIKIKCIPEYVFEIMKGYGNEESKN